MTAAVRYNLLYQFRKQSFLERKNRGSISQIKAKAFQFIIPKSKIFEKAQKFDSTPTDNFSPYDTQSIMHYDGLLRGFFPKSNPIMKDKITGLSIGINRQMSKLDIEKLNEMYPCKPVDPLCGRFVQPIQ